MVTERGDEGTRVRGWAQRSRQEIERPFIWYPFQAFWLHVDWEQIVRTEFTHFRSSHFRRALRWLDANIESISIPISFWSQMRSRLSSQWAWWIQWSLLEHSFHLILYWFGFPLDSISMTSSWSTVKVRRIDASENVRSTAAALLTIRPNMWNHGSSENER